MDSSQWRQNNLHTAARWCAALHDYEPHDSSSRAAGSLSAAQRCSGAVDLRSFGRRRRHVTVQVEVTTDSKTHSESLRQEFNRWAEADRGEGMEHDHLPIVLPVLDRMRLAPEDNVLDLGCGTGWLARLLAEQVPEGRVVGVDISDEMIRRARHNNVDLENAMFVIGEAEEIPWDASFFTQ